MYALHRKVADAMMRAAADGNAGTLERVFSQHQVSLEDGLTPRTRRAEQAGLGGANFRARLKMNAARMGGARVVGRVAWNTNTLVMTVKLILRVNFESYF